MTRALSRRQWNLLAAGVLLVGSLFIAATRAQPAATVAAPPPAAVAAEPAPLPDHPAPDFTLTALDGTSVTLSDLRGQVALINIWATWCPPCRAEMPAIQAAYDQYRDRGLAVLAVNQREDAATVASFLQDRGLTFPALLDRDGLVSGSYQALALPSSFFVDRRGVVRAVYRGPMPPSVVAGTLEQLLSEER